MKNSNDIIKSFDSSDEHIEQLQVNLNNELSGLPLLTLTIRKGQKIFRCRNIKKVSDYPLFEKDISYRSDIDNITNIGRCNWERSSRFYGSIQSGDLPGDVTAIAEISNLMRRDEEGSELYAVGVWKAKEDFNLMVIKPPSSIISESKIINEIRNAFNDALKNDNLSVDQIEFLELYGKEMVQKVAPDENDKYTISSLISETILNYQPGMIYTSVQSDHKGLNVVMKPKEFDKYFFLETVVIGEFYKFKNKSTFRPTSVCIDPINTPFHYDEPSEKDRSTNDEIIALFDREGIPHDYIVEKLHQQIAN